MLVANLLHLLQCCLFTDFCIYSSGNYEICLKIKYYVSHGSFAPYKYFLFSTKLLKTNWIVRTCIYLLITSKSSVCIHMIYTNYLSFYLTIIIDISYILWFISITFFPRVMKQGYLLWAKAHLQTATIQLLLFKSSKTFQGCQSVWPCQTDSGVNRKKAKWKYIYLIRYWSQAFKNRGGCQISGKWRTAHQLWLRE